MQSGELFIGSLAGSKLVKQNFKQIGFPLNEATRVSLYLLELAQSKATRVSLPRFFKAVLQAQTNTRATTVSDVSLQPQDELITHSVTGRS